MLQFGARLREADPRALSSALWAMVQLDYFPGEDTVRGLEREFAARLAEPGGRPVWRRPVVSFVNALTHYRRSVGRRPSEGLLERIEAWILGNVAAAGGIEALAQQARLILPAACAQLVWRRLHPDAASTGAHGLQLSRERVVEDVYAHASYCLRQAGQQGTGQSTGALGSSQSPKASAVHKPGLLLWVSGFIPTPALSAAAARLRQATAARIDDRSPGMRVRDASMLLWAWHTFQRPMPAAVLEARAAPRPASWSRAARSRALQRCCARGAVHSMRRRPVRRLQSCDAVPEQPRRRLPAACAPQAARRTAAPGAARA